MKVTTRFWEFAVFPTFIKATPTKENRFADGVRIYASSFNFINDFDYDEVTEKIIEHFDRNKTSNKKSYRRSVVEGQTNGEE